MSAVEITGVDIETIRSRILKAFDAAGFANAKIYFHITRGSEPRDRVWNADLKPNFFHRRKDTGHKSLDPSRLALETVRHQIPQPAGKRPGQ